MTEVTPTLSLHPVDSTTDAITAILHRGARRLLSVALDAEVEAFLARYADLHDEAGHRAVVRNGHLPEREVQTGIGPVAVKQPRVRTRPAAGGTEVPKFTSKILPPYLRRTRSIEELIPWLYLKGISTNDYQEALAALLGPEAPGLSASTVVRLKKAWEDEYSSWRTRLLRGKRFVYLWADGIHFNIRLEDDRSCILVVIGATEDGTKELLAVHDGVRESELSWREVLIDLKTRGLELAPSLATGDGALGFWKALREVFPETREQRCWVHKTANVLNYRPKRPQPEAKRLLHEVWMASTKHEAEAALDAFVEVYRPKYPRAADCLSKDRDALLTFYDFPAEHWQHLRTTNPIESTFATVRLRTNKTKGCGSRVATLTMVFKLAQSAANGWRRLTGSKLIADIIKGISFKDGIKEDAAA
jgi:transposase-like protein